VVWFWFAVWVAVWFAVVVWFWFAVWVVVVVSVSVCVEVENDYFIVRRIFG
jgi:hypothetical protein